MVKRSVQEWFAISALAAIVITAILGMILQDFIGYLVSGLIFSVVALIWWAIVAWLAKKKTNTPAVVLSWIMGIISLLFAVLQVLGLFV